MTGQKINCCSDKFVYTGNGSAPAPWNGDGIKADPKYVAGFDRNKMRPGFIKYPDRKATICDPKLRSINVDAECGGPDDFWYFAPWRAPGMAPVTPLGHPPGGTHNKPEPGFPYVGRTTPSRLTTSRSRATLKRGLTTSRSRASPT